ncbi:MAG: UDP-N-acetylglucosamine 2-epimerase [Microgenomates group bacterium GW2011_GWA2_37_6]|nr:MAG: UDP-N-acetylglucosamine 2-epimerase [Microgenomates group bacterium GW2011_GWA2_37_6]
MKKKKLAFVLGIRPDIIRAVLIMRYLEKAKDIDVIFIWSGQHYSDNLKEIFFREFKLRNADYELGCRGETDAEITGDLIKKLYVLLEKIKPNAVVFLGDTNTTVGALASAMLNIPIIHIEGCWRSSDWRMPEEKYRTIVDHLSDVIYTYEEEYKERGIAEGLNSGNIVVTKNPIVDVLNEFYFKQKERLEKIANEEFFEKRGIENGGYYLMTCHRRENVHIDKSFKTILNFVSKAKFPVYFPASYRTQEVIKKRKLKLSKNLIMVDPVGYEEMLILITHSKGVFTDSGTLIEETSVLNIPAVQIRKSTERPQVYDVKGAVKFDPDQGGKYTPEIIYKKLERITGIRWKHTLGDGKTSKRIADDLIVRLRKDKLRGHLPKNSNLPIKRSFMEDGIKI